MIRFRNSNLSRRNYTQGPNIKRHQYAYLKKILTKPDALHLQKTMLCPGFSFHFFALTEKQSN